MNELKIIQIENGFICEYDDQNEDGNGTHTVKLVFEDLNNDEFSYLDTFTRMLYYIVEHFGMSGSKHDKKRIKISTKNT